MSGETAWHAAEALASWAWRAGWQGAALAVGVGVILWIAGRRISPAWRFGLWGLVLVRMAMPAVVEVNIASRHADPARNSSATVAINEGAAGQVAAGRVRLVPAWNGEHRLSREEFAAIVATLPPQAPDPAISATPRQESVGATNQVKTRWQRLVGWFSTLPRAILSAKHVLVAVWLSGVILLGLRVAWSSVRLARAVERMRVIDDPRVLELMASCAKELGIASAPQARALTGGGAPALVGFVRPRVLLPSAVIAGMGDEELRLILMHELAHVKRRDVLIGWLATLVAVLHWPNPAGWIVGWRMRVERELACDEMVMRGDREGGAYARTIVKLVEALSSMSSPIGSSAPGGTMGGRVPARLPGGAVGILEGKSQIQRRLLMIARFNATARRWPAVAAGLGLIVGAMALSGITRAAEPGAAGGPAVKSPHQPDGAGPAVKPADPAIGAAPGAGAPGQPDKPGSSRGAAAAPGEPKGAEGDATQPGKSKRGMMGAYAGPVSAEDDAANAKTAAKLRKAVAQVTFNGQAFSDVVAFLRDATKVDIIVEWSALEQAGITRDTPVTFELHEPTPVDAVLTLMFRSMGLGLQYELEKGVVVISPSTSQPTAVMRVYDVSDLISKATGEVTAGEGAAGSPGFNRGGGGGGSGGGGWGGAARSPADKEIDQLIRLIVSTVEPNTWRDSGGDLGSISAFKNKLVVKTSEGVHKEIAALLEMLRDKPGAGKEKHGL